MLTDNLPLAHAQDSCPVVGRLALSPTIPSMCLLYPAHLKISQNTSKGTEAYFSAKAIKSLLFKDLLVCSSVCRFAPLAANPHLEVAASTSIAHTFVRAGMMLADRAGKPTFLLTRRYAVVPFECHIIQSNLLVWGDFNKRLLSANCRQAKHITVTGYSKPTPVATRRSLCRAKIPLLLYFPANINGASLSTNNSAGWCASSKWPQGTARIYFKVKPKPGDLLGFPSRGPDFYCKETSTEQQILHSDIVIVTSSAEWG